ncbi:putative DD41D transposase [Trichonephila clavipes]|nr:putative DD41D transposase [Trichonephila clavipes]
MQEQDIEERELEPLDPVQSEDRMTVDSRLNNAFRFVEWAQNEIDVVPDFHKRSLFSDEAHFWWNGYVNKQNCRIWSEANPQVYVETPLHPEKLTIWCALWAGGILLQKL